MATFSQNQFFISGLAGDEIIRNRVLEALYRRIMRAYNDKKCFRVIVVIPLLPGFQVLFRCQNPSNMKFDYLLHFLTKFCFNRGVWMTGVQHL